MISVLLIAHGSRRPEANDDLFQLAEALRAKGYAGHVEAAFLELAEPDIPEGIARCVQAGANEVRLVPYFLSMGRHVADDLRRFRDEAANAYPSVHFTLSRPLGPHEKLLEIVIERIHEPAPDQ